MTLKKGAETLQRDVSKYQKEKKAAMRDRWFTHNN